MSSEMEVFEAEDAQQVQHVAELDEREVQARIDMICDRLRYESESLRAYVRLTSLEAEPPSWMPTCTAANIGEDIARWTQQAADDRDEMLACGGARS